MTESPKTLRVILFGATGMIGSGVLQACLNDPHVEAVLVVGRSACGISSPKLKEILHKDFFDYAPIQAQLAGHNACLFTLGVTSAGMSEADYSRMTYDLTVAAAEAVLRANPGCAFAYVSGQGTDATEQGRMMWARVKGRLENKLLAMDFHPAIMFRPGGIQPMAGVRSKTRWYRLFYMVLGPVLPFMVRHFPAVMTTSERVGRAMLRGVRGETEMRIVESVDINRLGA